MDVALSGASAVLRETAAWIDANPRADAQREAMRAQLIVVVLDDCDDFSGAIARAYGVEMMSLKARNVGIARATGADCLLTGGARWLAFTDADSRVSRGWLVAQLGLGADAVCGSIAMDDWTAHPLSVREYFHKTYVDADGRIDLPGAVPFATPFNGLVRRHRARQRAARIEEGMSATCRRYF
ncbi:MAG: Glycosyl transferase, group 2 family [uncultured Paraburkholderia sp.]|nr:MAG: Glycosyl transferase, group 2 family [uncultured Paraburkholderia sp.]CAH2930365.1 MAG: Glycosyl transferase, group 2 family [uncultured Paraburkholderia sp.]